MHVTVLTERGQRHKVPIDGKTRIGQVVEIVAYKVSRKPNLMEASLTYNGSLLPFDMRACALPEGATLAFQMANDEATLTTTSLDTTVRVASSSRHTLLIQLPNTADARRVHVNTNDPVSCLRSVLDISPNLLIHYNKRPILDESRSICSLRMTDRYPVTFAPYHDSSFLTATSPFKAAPPRGVVKPPSQLSTFHLSELQSPKKSAGKREPDLPSDAPLPGLHNGVASDRSVFGEHPREIERSIAFQPRASSPERSRAQSWLDRTSDRMPSLPPPTPMPVARGDLFGSMRQRDDLSDMRPMQAPSVGAASPAPSWNRSPARSRLGHDVSNNPPYAGPSSHSRNQSANGGGSARSAIMCRTIRIYVSDPEDGCFTHDIEVNPERMVASLNQFVEHPEWYNLHCDTELISNPEHTTFWDATGGKNGSLFTFEQRRDPRYR